MKNTRKLWRPKNKDLWVSIFIHATFALIAFWTIHAWFTEGMVPVECWDEEAATFVENPLFFKALMSGQYLLINLFNAFGTPLIGEAVFVPWAPQTLSYAFLPGWQGMMLNKFLIMFGTLEVLYLFARQWKFSANLAFWFAIMSATNPAFLYFMDIHAHMGSVLYFTLVLLAFERLKDQFSLWRLLALFVSYLVLILGIGINAVVFAHIFLLGYLLVSVGALPRKRLLLVLLGMFGVFMIYAPHLFSFLQWAPLTARSQITIFEMPLRGAFDWYSLMLSATMLIISTGFHADFVVIQTFVVPTLLGLAVIMTLGAPSLWSSRPRLFGLFAIGAFSTVTVFVLLARVDWLRELPFFKSTDITRFMWFSMIFLNLGFAQILEKFFATKSTRIIKIGLPLLAAVFIYPVTIYLGIRPPQWPALEALDDWILLTTAGALLVLIWHLIRPISPRYVWLAVIILLLPKLVVFDFVGTREKSLLSDRGIMPAGLERFIPPFSRMAGLYAAGESPDQRLTAYSVFGAGGRQIILSRELKEFFERNNLVDSSNFAWWFKTASADRLDELGIRYVVTVGETLNPPNWRELAVFPPRLAGPYRLYERTQMVTPVYCSLPARKYINAEYSGNFINVNMDDNCDLLIATFYLWPGWRLMVNDVEQILPTSPAVFLQAEKLKKGDRVQFRFDPWWTRVWWVFIAFGLSLIGLSLFFSRKHFERSRSGNNLI